MPIPAGFFSSKFSRKARGLTILKMSMRGIGRRARRRSSSVCFGKREVPIGLLVNGQEIRLVYAPEKELSGYVDFQAIRNAECRRPADLRRLPHAAEFGAALQCR